MNNKKPAGQKWLLAFISVVTILLLQLDNNSSAFSALQGEDMLPVLIVTVVVFLMKAGVLSAAVMLLHKLLTWIRGKK